jgi:hypothetical protein
MNIKPRIIMLAVLAVCFHLPVSMAAGSQLDPYPGLVLPVYQGAYDIEISASRLKGTKSLTYKVQTDYPATEVLEYYDTALNGSGWKPSFEICQRHWASPDDGSIERELQAKQLFTSWAHSQYKLQISLLLEYQHSNTQNRDFVMVRCRLQPQLDNSRLDKLVGRLKASGKYRAFNKKLDTYRNPNGEVELASIDRDIRANKADENLIEYRRILVERKQAIDEIIRRVNATRQPS